MRWTVPCLTLLLGCEEDQYTQSIAIPYEPAPGVDVDVAREAALASGELDGLRELERLGVIVLGEPVSPSAALSPPPPSHCPARVAQSIRANGPGQHVMLLSDTTSSAITYQPQCAQYPCVTEVHSGGADGHTKTEFRLQAGGQVYVMPPAITSPTDLYWAYLLVSTSPADILQLRSCTCAGANCSPVSRMAVHFVRP